MFGWNDLGFHLHDLIRTFVWVKWIKWIKWMKISFRNSNLKKKSSLQNSIHRRHHHIISWCWYQHQHDFGIKFLCVLINEANFGFSIETWTRWECVALRLNEWGNHFWLFNDRFYQIQHQLTIFIDSFIDSFSYFNILMIYMI